MKRIGLGKIAAACVLAITILPLAACTQQAASVQTDGQTTIYGQVTAIDGNKITLALGTMDQPSGTMPQGGNQPRGTRPQGGNQPNGTWPQGGQPDSSNPQGNNQRGGFFNQLTLTGITKTITIADTSILTKINRAGFGNQGPARNSGSGTGYGSKPTGTISAADDAATLADIAIGCILKVVYVASSEKLIAVQIIDINFN